MIKSTKNLFLLIALASGTIAFTNCSSAPTASNNGNTATVANSKPANTTTETAKTDTAKTDAATTAGDKIGVPECDDYIAKYEVCVNSKVPEAQRAMFKSQFETMRKTWKDAAATPQGKAGLASGCKTALDTAKQSMTAFSCSW